MKAHAGFLICTVTIFLIAGGVSLATEDAVAQEDSDPNIRLFVDVNSFILYVAADHAISLEGLQFRVINSEGETDTFAIVDRFDILKASDGIAPSGACYIYQIEGTTTGLPEDCSNPSLVFREDVVRADVFWYDFTDNQQRNIAILRDNEPIIQFCPSSLKNCPILFLTATPLPTNTAAPTPTVPTLTPTMTSTSTETPTPAPTSTNTLLPTNTPFPSSTSSPTITLTLTPSETPSGTPSAVPTSTTITTGDGSPSSPIAVIETRSRINQIAWNPDNQYIVSAHSGGSICVWKVGDPQNEGVSQNCNHNAHTGDVWAVSWEPISISQPESIRFASGGQDGRVQIWDINNLSAPLRTLDAHHGPVRDVEWSPNPGRSFLFSAGDDGKIFVWNTDDWTAFNIPINAPRALALRSDGQALASIDSSGVIRITDVLTSQTLQIGSHAGEGMDIAWHPVSNYLATVGAPGMVRLIQLDLNKGQNCSEPADPACSFVRLAQNLEKPKVVKFSPSGQLIAFTTIGGVHVLESQPSYRRIDIYETPIPAEIITTMAWSPDSQMISAANEQGRIYLWKVTEEVPERITLQSSWPATTSGGINAVTWSRDGKRVAIVETNQNVSVWEIDTQIRVGISTTSNGNPLSIDWSASTPLIATGGCIANDDGVTIQWDTTSLNEGQKDAELIERNRLDGDLHRACVTSLAFDQDGFLLATGDSIGILRLFDWQASEELSQITVNDRINDLAWDVTGTYVATVSDTGKFSVWNTSENRFQEVYWRHPKAQVPLKSLAWDPDGLKIATGSQASWIAIWDFQSDQPKLEGYYDGYLLQGHQHPIISLSWHPVQNWLLSLSEDGQLIVWDAETGEQLAQQKLDGRPTRVSWSPTGTLFVTVNSQGIISFWAFTD